MASLFNFDIDGADLKQEHIDWLERHVMARARTKAVSVWAHGRASRTASNRRNLNLSERRVRNLADYLVRGGVIAHVGIHNRFVAFGEERSYGPLDEDPQDRAVEIAVLFEDWRPGRPVPPPPPVRPAAPPLPLSTEFYVRSVGGVGFDFVIGQDHAGFQFWDRRLRRVAMYQYTGVNGGVGTPTLSWRGEWNRFVTSGPMSVGQFGGFTRFGGAGALFWDRTYLVLMGVPAGIQTVTIDPFRTGFTLGASLSAGAGVLELVTGPMDESAFNSRYPRFRTTP